MDTGEDIATFLSTLLVVLREEAVLATPQEKPVVVFKQPDLLQKELNLTLDETCTEEELLLICRKVARYSVKTSHPYFLNQLYAGVDKYGLAGALFSEALNTNQYTYEVAPAFSLCEMEVIRKSLKLVGFTQGDGIFSPGGSLSNMYGIVLARYQKCPNVKKSGIAGMKPFVVFTSKDAHYSFTKGAHWLGIGTDNVKAIEADFNGRMIPEKIEEAIKMAIKEDKVPIMVNATAGTTVLGAFDKFNDIADICKKYGIWMHVDACWGGSLLFSKDYRYKLNGIERADSISWNPHKMLGAPLQCSMFLVKHTNLLKECNMAGATYLFQQDKMYDVKYDSGDKSLQCGRKVDAFKFWSMWKIRGSDQLSHMVDNAINCAKYFLEEIKKRHNFILLLEEFDTSNVCFWYIPERLIGLEKTKTWWDEVNQIAPNLKKKFVEESCLMIGYQPLAHRNLKNFFRLVVTCHPVRTKAHMDNIIQMFERHGKNL
ncbi:cysteine sulfinic acid decarboxylase [Cimex lectularius]|uniref:Glutamate decarboxylase n=1 Tax=Cimex lectularius TaxID=79782 RepID=A0A8I6SBQ3_CIMLE|nr:cysteine sulfinic acid decarboxylase [Cimex lectularius]